MGGHRISARRFYRNKTFFQELGTNLKKKDQNSRNKVKTQEKGSKLKKKGTKLTKLQAQGGGQLPPCPPLWPPLYILAEGSPDILYSHTTERVRIHVQIRIYRLNLIHTLQYW